MLRVHRGARGSYKSGYGPNTLYAGMECSKNKTPSHIIDFSNVFINEHYILNVVLSQATVA